MDFAYGLEVSQDRPPVLGMVGVTTRSKSKLETSTNQQSIPVYPSTSTVKDAPQKFVPHFDITRLKEEQGKDQKIRDKIEEVCANPTKHPYVFQDGILYKLATRNRGATKSKLIYLPSSMIAPALREYHDHPTAGHFSSKRTYYKMKFQYWWPDMYHSTEDYIKACLSCQQHNHNRKKRPGHLKPLPPPHGPFQVIGIDFCGPFSRTPNENRYVLCITDHFTRWVTAVALPDCKAETIYNEYICKYGVPTTILSDQGNHFKNQLMDATAILLGHHHIYSTTYHPQTNGMIERFNATFVPQLAKLQDTESNNWDSFLPSVVFAYNTGQHNTTGYSPFQLQYGQKSKLPPDEPPKQVIFAKPNDYYQQLKKNLKIYHEYARRNMVRQQERSKQRYDAKRPDPHYSVGQLVLTRYYGSKFKLDQKYSKVPYRVIDCQYPVYWVKDIETQAESRMLRRIRSYYTKKLTENEELRSKLPPFTIDQQYNVYYITKLTSRTTMDYLINIISSTTTIIVDTETDDQSHEPALIQITPVVQPLANTAIDVQKEYRRYYNEKHPHEQCCPSRYQDTDDAATFTLNAPDDDIDLDPHADHVACTCPFRPYKDPKNKLTRSDWGGGIDRELGTWEFSDRRIRDDQRQIRRDLQQYAINDVLAVLAIIRERDRYKQLNNRRKVSTINLAPRPPEQLMDYENPPEAQLQPQQRISALVCESISITGMEMSRMVHVDEPLVSVLQSHCLKHNRLCIGLKNEESREEFNRRIPPFLFTAEHYRQLNGPPQTPPHPQELPKPLELPDQQ
ncbi:unnamed protein product [Didymodactylos carnosus]|uniref:Integrase catalytic domain-containing protein n=1 Tax=Didymodactylos carnosus TaxID=1234261 RepID=A0A8S2PJ01_9BILA|nr:unnamed protein product [Didymodactylos carnosus]